MTVQRLSHIGLCVADLERSLRFYRDVFGFAERSRLALGGAHSATLLELPGGRVEAIYLERDGTRLELVRYPDAGHEAESGVRPMNRLGLSHLSFRVDDLDATLAAVEETGGRCLVHTRIDHDTRGTKAIFVLDPDGQRIELLQAPGDPQALPGE